MYNENVRKEMNEMKELLERIERLNSEAKLYNEEDAKPILYNIEKLQEEYDNKKNDIIARYEITKNQIKEGFDEKLKLLRENFEKEKKELEEPYNKKIEEINIRIEKLNKEKALHEKDEAYKEAVQNNIDRLEEKIRILQETEGKRIADILKAKEDDINLRIESTNKKVNAKMGIVKNDLKEINVIVEQFSLEDKKELEEKPKSLNLDEKEIPSDEEVEDNNNEKEEVYIEENIEEEKIIDDDLEIIDLDKEEMEISENSKSVRILYSAKTDKYLVTNVNRKEQKIVNRQELDKLDANLLAEKMGKDLTNVDINILQLLLSYDKKYKTSKAYEYIDMLSTPGKNKEQRQNEMQENQIDIEYNLKGLYDRHEEELYEYEYNFSKEERQELLNIANMSKTKGIAKVTKGIKVTIMGLVDKVARKISSNKLLKGKNMKQIPEKVENAEQEELEKAYKEELKRTKRNKKAAKNIENVSKSQKETNEKIINGYTWENGNIVPKVKINHEQALNNIKNNENNSEASMEEIR